MKRFLTEPLVHFFVLAALLFAAYRYVNPEPAADARRIVVSPGRIEHMVATFAQTWRRPPTAGELKGLIDQFVREEVLNREAIKLGLDRDDVIIRRRLQQKMEFIAEDIVAAAEPTDADLSAYLSRHPDAFRQDQRVTFRHVYLNPDRHGERLDADAATLLADLRTKGAQADVATLGDPTLLAPAYRDEPRGRIEAEFGPDFAASLATIPVGEWSGPTVSGFGMHLVLVERRSEGRVPALDEVRAQVRREWENARRVDADRQLLAELLKHYEVSVEWPKDTTDRAARGR